MDRKAIYLISFFLVLGAGLVLSATRIIPTENTVIFLFALDGIRSGLAGLLGLHPGLISQPKGYRMSFSLADIGLGLVWLPLSLSPLSHQGLPVFLTAAPFLTVIVVSKFVLSEKV